MKTLVCHFQRDLAPYQNKASKGSKPYHYILETDQDVKVGDFAVIARNDTLRDLEDFGICQIDEIIDGLTPEAKKPVVCVLDLTTHRERLDRSKQRQALLRQLSELETRQNELDRFKRLAETSPEAANLLSKLEALV